MSDTEGIMIEGRTVEERKIDVLKVTNSLLNDLIGKFECNSVHLRCTRCGKTRDFVNVMDTTVCMIMAGWLPDFVNGETLCPMCKK